MFEPSWPHLQIVYEFFLRFIVSGGTCVVHSPTPSSPPGFVLC